MKRFARAGSPRPALLMLAAPALSQPAPEPPVRIEIKSKLIETFESRDPARKRFGALEFRGGIELSSPHKEFGGLSGHQKSPPTARISSR